MSAAAMPSLSLTIIVTASIAAFVGFVAAVAVWLAVADAEEATIGEVITAVVVTLLTVALVTTAITALIYHAAWIDYRRGR